MMVDVLRHVGTVACAMLVQWPGLEMGIKVVQSMRQAVVGGALCILLVVIGNTLNALPHATWVIRDEMLLYLKSIVRFCCLYAGCQASPGIPECV